MKRVFEVPIVEIIDFASAEILTTDHDSIGDGDINKNFDELE